MAKLTRFNPDGIHKPFAGYSHTVTAEGAQKLVFCAGQVAADADGKVLPPDDFEAQTRMVMGNLTKALAAGGARLSDVVKVTIYVCNQHDVPKASRNKSESSTVTDGEVAGIGGFRNVCALRSRSPYLME